MATNNLKTITGLGALVLSGSVWANGQIVAVDAKTPNQGATVISVHGSDLDAPKVIRAKGMVIVQFDASYAGTTRQFAVNTAGVDNVKIGKFSLKPAKTRVSLHVNKSIEPVIEPSEDGYTITVGQLVAKATKPSAESFPTATPPLEPAPKKANENGPAMAMTAPTEGTGSGSGNASPMVRVSLDFVGTDIVQILKALAMQSNVNIVTSPEVAGKLTISLNNVTLGEALDIVTAMGGVRYTRTGNTYVVTSSARFADTLQALSGKADMATETRVVPIFSRQGVQVKAAVLKTVPLTTQKGRYDLLLSNEEIGIRQTAPVQPNNQPGGDSGKGGDGGKQPDAAMTQNATGGGVTAESVDNYMIIVGTPARLDEVERCVRLIDLKVCEAMGVKVPDTNGTVVKSYEPKGIPAEDLLSALRMSKGVNMGSVQTVATPRGSMSKQVIVLSGRANEVETLWNLLNGMDSLADTGTASFEVVGLKFIRPQVAMVQLIDAVPGLRAKLMPAPVDPLTGLAYTEKAYTGPRITGGDTSGQGANGGGNAQGNQSGVSGSGTGNNGTNTQGNGAVGTAPKQGSENATDFSAGVATYQTPMCLLLRGTPDQIASAKRYLEMVDKAPKQVAIELRVMELSKDDALKFGLDWSLAAGGTLKALRLNQGLGTDTTAGGFSGSSTFKGGGTLGAIGLLDQITTKTNLLARPSVLATDGVLTNIFVGDEVRYVESITNSQNGPSVTTNKVDVGVDFYVVPRVGLDGNITLQLNPTLSILQGFTPVGNGGQLPQTSRRSASTLVNIKSGETIAIGGLIQDQDRKVFGGIPILKDIPLIGRLFGRTNNQRTRSEVVFFVTVREVTESDRQAPANPNWSERNNNQWPGQPDKKKSGGG